MIRAFIDDDSMEIAPVTDPTQRDGTRDTDTSRCVAWWPLHHCRGSDLINRGTMSDLSCRLPGNDPSLGDEESRLRDILLAARIIAVVGLSNDPWRPSHGVAEYLQGQGYRIVPVNPNERAVLGEKSYATLEAVPFPIDIVDIFRRSELVAPLVDSAIALHAKAIWMQESVVDAQSAQRARAAGLAVAMDRCILKDHARWKRESEPRQ